MLFLCWLTINASLQIAFVYVYNKSKDYFQWQKEKKEKEKKRKQKKDDGHIVGVSTFCLPFLTQLKRINPIIKKR